MTVILVLLCLAIAGRELYLAFDRKRPVPAPELADVRTQLAALKDTRDELERFRAAQAERLDRLAAERAAETESVRETDTRVRSLVAQINERMVPDVNARLTRQREQTELLAAELGTLRAHLVARLDQAVAASLGAEPADVIAGALAAVTPGPSHDNGDGGGGDGGGDGGGLAEAPPDLPALFEGFAERYGLRVELVDAVEHGGVRRVRYFLSGRSPRGLERDFIDLVSALRSSGGRSGGETDAACALLKGLRGVGAGCVQLGPLLLVRTPESLLCGVLPLADLLRPDTAALVADPAVAAVRLHRLPGGRFCDASTWPGTDA